jgi:hypothetical protein
MLRMTTTWGWAILAIAFLCPRADAQGVPGMISPGASAGAAAGAGSNPSGPAAGGLGGAYANPYTNPLLNPYMMMMQPNVGRTNALLYMWGAQQGPGGLLNNPVANSRSRTASTASRTLRQSMRPGGRASYYFSRGAVSAETSRSYFQRYNRYYGSIGR